MRAEYTKVSWADLAPFSYATSRVYSGPLGCDDVAFVINRQPVGVTATYHHHERAAEVCVLLAGRGRIRMGDHVVEMEPLDAIRIAPGVPHSNGNAGDTEALWLIIGTPIDEYTAEEPEFYGVEAHQPPTVLEVGEGPAA